MPYYHLRFNTYPQPGFPVEKEQWIELAEPHNDIQMRQYLLTEQHDDVSVIVSKVICQEEYDYHIKFRDEA